MSVKRNVTVPSGSSGISHPIVAGAAAPEQAPSRDHAGRNSADADVMRAALAAVLIAAFFQPAHPAAPVCGGVPATLVGTAANDVLTGTEGDDVIVGLGGSDKLAGGGGADLVCGGDGADRLFGGGDADQLYAGAGNDV